MNKRKQALTCVIVSFWLNLVASIVSVGAIVALYLMMGNFDKIISDSVNNVEDMNLLKKVEGIFGIEFKLIIILACVALGVILALNIFLWVIFKKKINTNSDANWHSYLAIALGLLGIVACILWNQDSVDYTKNTKNPYLNNETKKVNVENAETKKPAASAQKTTKVSAPSKTTKVAPAKTTKVSTSNTTKIKK